ncbi:hypothetical protein TcG_09376 [Trypanosoma cruzi]|nr:hypothetical protein TcG_09376 [Trypanosoma cruzi]
MLGVFSFVFLLLFCFLRACIFILSSISYLLLPIFASLHTQGGVQVTCLRSARLLRGELRLGAGAVSPEALHDALRRLFPPFCGKIRRHTYGTAASPRTAPRREGHDSPYSVSGRWRDALLLVELSKMCSASSVADARCEESLPSRLAGASPATDAVTHATAESETIAYILRHCRFPVECWWISLNLLERWRLLQSETMSLGSFRKRTSFFPADISPASCAHLMRNLSYTCVAWVDVLRLYELATRDVAAPEAARRQRETTDRAGDEPRASRRVSLRWMRHTALTSLLQANQWKESLHFYRHMLYQGDTPSHVSAGHLVQRLGKAGAWEAVVRIFELHLKLIAATPTYSTARQGNDGAEHLSARVASPTVAPTRVGEWGTMFSMSLDVVGRVCRRPLIAIQMFNEACNRNIDGSLFRWDGNFLSAVQSFPSELDRVNVLRRAHASGQLDQFKIIRGLVHHGKWLEAIAVFADGLATQQLHRRDIGRSRLNILHASSGDSVQAVLYCLQRLTRRPENSLRVNDAEVECVLSKVPSMQSTSSGASFASMAHWRFCLQVLSENYASLATSGGRGVMPGNEGRRPTQRMVSLLLRHSMPWNVALRIFELSCRLNMAATPYDPAGASSTPSNVLIINRVAHILHAHGQRQRMIEFLDSVLCASPLSPSSELLEFVPLEFFSSNRGVPERKPLMVEDKVLYHFVETTMNWERALTLLRLVEDQRAGAVTGKVKPLQVISASVHCTTLKMLRRCCAAHGELWLHSLRYFQHAVSGLHLLDCHTHPRRLAQQHGDTDVNTILYCILYETLLNLLEEPSGASIVLREKTCFSLMECVTARCGGRIPTHMLLPNQMDRLLPRLDVGEPTVPNVEERTRVSMKLIMCVLVGLLGSTGKEGLKSPHMTPPDAVMFYELQKLVCRVAEYRHYLMRLHETGQSVSNSASPRKTAATEKRVVQQPFQMGLLWQTSLELLGCQCRACGVDSMMPGTLKLVYLSCATSGGQWEAALHATQCLLQHPGAVGGEHCAMYCSLFGWERALAVWCRHFPQQMLREVSGHAKGLEYCMQSLECSLE